jgi:hypothetical protein
MALIQFLKISFLKGALVHKKRWFFNDWEHG